MGLALQPSGGERRGKTRGQAQQQLQLARLVGRPSLWRLQRAARVGRQRQRLVVLAGGLRVGMKRGLGRALLRPLGRPVPSAAYGEGRY